MGLEAIGDAERQALESLGWGASELYVATVCYGSVGTLDQLRRHLSTGDDLGRSEEAVLFATLHDALLDRGQPSPFGLEGDAYR
jgi:hypothetical protein